MLKVKNTDIDRMSDQQTAMQPRPTQYTVQIKMKETEGLIYTHTY